MVLLAVLTPLQAQDVVANARRIAIAGDRKQALRLLVKHLDETPSDTDARVLYGTVLSWDHEYDAARTQLSRVIAEKPENGDAMQALANVELATGHPDRAEDLLARLLKDRPNDTDLLYADARALIALKRQPEASGVLQRLLGIDPGNRDASRLRESLREAPKWQASVQQYQDWYTDSIGNRTETQVSLKRDTPGGSVIGRFSSAESFGLTGRLIETDLYQSLHKGTYVYLNLGYSPDAKVYPRYRVGSDFFQSLTHGFEGTAGYRRLGFPGAVNVYTTALSKYYRSWLFTGRGYFTPDVTGTSQSFQLTARYYLPDSVSYLQARFGHGSSATEIRSVVDVGVLDSNSSALALNRLLGRHWGINGEFGFAREDRPGRPSANHYTMNAGALFRF